MINALNTLKLCKVSAKFNEKYVRSRLNSTKYMQVLRQIQCKICNVYAKINAKYVRSTLNSTQNMEDLRFIRIAALKETKVRWRNGRRGDK